MIPQRNLSLLANRLHKEHGGRRIPEAVLERDYCLAWFLVGMGQSRLGQILTFKGETALKRCHFGDYRFSEDLDFTLARPAEFAEIREGLEEVFERVAQASGIRFAFEREDGERHVNSHTFYLSYQGPLPNPNTVKVDITTLRFFCFRSNSVWPYAPIRNLKTCPKTVRSRSTVSTISRPRRSSPFPIRRGMNRVISTISGFSRSQPECTYRDWLGRLLKGFVS